MRALAARCTGRGGAALAFGLALAAAVLAYLPGLGGLMLLDDFPQLSALLDGRAFDLGWSGFLWSDSGPLGRPVAMASFLLNALAGGDLYWWKLVNVAIHALNGVLVFQLAAQLWHSERLRPEARAWWTAALLAALWLLHPLQVSTVLYTVQRMTELSALFVLAGLLAYVRGRKRQLAGAGGGTAAVVSCFVLFLPLAVLSKENGALLVPLAFATEVLLFRFRGGPGARRALAWLYGAFLALPLAVALGVALLDLHAALLDRYAGRPFTLEQRLLTELRALTFYLRLLLVPVQRQMGFFHDDFALSRGWLDPPQTLVSGVLIVALLALAWALRRRVPLASLGIVFFFVGHALESTLLPLELVYEHRNYLPSFGVFLAVLALIARARLSVGTGAALGVPVLLMLVALTAFRTQTWGSGFLFYNYVLRVHPGSQRAAAVMAQQITETGAYSLALRYLDGLPGSGAALQRLYIRCRRDGRITGADLDAVQAALDPPLGSYTASGLMELGRLGLDGQCAVPPAPFAALLESALRLPATDPKSAYKLWLHRAHYLWRLHRPDAAMAALEVAHGVWPEDPLSLLLAAQWQAESDHPERARAYLARARGVANGSRFAYKDLVEHTGALLRELDGTRRAGAGGTGG